MQRVTVIAEFQSGKRVGMTDIPLNKLYTIKKWYLRQGALVVAVK